ncbi:MAG: ATPase, T2SS/T4P/T4SS family [Erysipelotrichaceae bacterium]
MQKKLASLLNIANHYYASDIHFIVQQEHVKISIRGIRGIVELHDEAFDYSLFNYLKYLANLDLGNMTLPQSGNFQLELDGKELYFRFSLLISAHLQTAVLRILNNHQSININQLSNDHKQCRSFYNWTKFRSGLIILSGPTGSGKTTTLHALLEEIAYNKRLKIITLEDPIEIVADSYLQLQINEKANFTYEEGIKQLLRHDPDVIMIGEIRDEATAKMAYRCALTGHMVFSTIHAKSSVEAIKRLEELGLKRKDLIGTLTAISAQRIYAGKGRKQRVCVYEILEKNELIEYLETGNIISHHFNIEDEIREAIKKGWISKKEASIDIKV